ncbi:MAG: dihydrofolate reductase family protein [Tuberibacillus sp.]
MEKRKVVLYIAESLDGYIARKDDELDWLFKVDGDGDNGYGKFYETVDTILLGRRTYDWILGHEKGNFPYKNKECYVFSRSETQHDNESVQFYNGSLTELIRHLKSQDGKNIWLVGGGDLILSFIKENLIDECRITIAPSIIGNGIPLFKEGDYELELSLKGMDRYNQFVELQYDVIHKRK